MGSVVGSWLRQRVIFFLIIVCKCFQGQLFSIQCINRALFKAYQTCKMHNNLLINTCRSYVVNYIWPCQPLWEGYHFLEVMSLYTQHTIQCNFLRGRILHFIKFSTSDNAFLAFWLVHSISIISSYTLVWPYMEINKISLGQSVEKSRFCELSLQI